MQNREEGTIRLQASRLAEMLPDGEDVLWSWVKYPWAGQTNNENDPPVTRVPMGDTFYMFCPYLVSWRNPGFNEFNWAVSLTVSDGQGADFADSRQFTVFDNPIAPYAHEGVFVITCTMPYRASVDWQIRPWFYKGDASLNRTPPKPWFW
jgi:hypothetical protein